MRGVASRINRQLTELSRATGVRVVDLSKIPVSSLPLPYSTSYHISECIEKPFYPTILNPHHSDQFSYRNAVMITARSTNIHSFQNRPVPITNDRSHDHLRHVPSDHVRQLPTNHNIGQGRHVLPNHCRAHSLHPHHPYNTNGYQ